MRIRGIVFLSLAALASIVGSARATPVAFEATDDATVQGAGPRTGSNGKAFYNMEGSANGSFASFGVSEFNFSTLTPTLGGTVTGVSGVSLQLTQSNAAFSVAAPISVYYTTNNSVNIQPGSSIKDAGGDGAASVDAAFSPLTLLGSGNFTNIANGTVDSVSLTSLSGSALTDFINALNSGGTIRLITTVDVAGGAATYAGNTNTTLAGPTLVFDATIAVPEPSTIVLCSFALAGVAISWKSQRRRRD